ncbi:hypothetical protein QN386_10445 [Pseudomonas sp. CCI3.2]|uniref:hypothetical protein n=1 Tax=unclassified Pseudomonas TaxID=196821 RepID=UPI002AC9E9A1|nr:MULTISPECIES: hypothetical protein [unclassified Pseudomonas]MEB0078284.1 hypothetical protein [Pseudomonas sp. MH10out]MEB0101738.1 hypothetical protein [Pseudomonas sp. CCI3.2]MEB0160183.1 hypothetical protein [Pseudomonas sp. AH2 (2023)]MEB0168013.1 hypothetical protein [Pseudomonas sp. CCC4.4]WPX28845.1 hypothetical protein RHM64_04085 [Pseudomonas sp. AH2]
MAGFEEVRLLEGMWAPLKVRLDLRQMFERWLSRSRYPRPIFEQDGMVDELSLLDLCQHYRLEYPGTAKDVAKTWNESEQRIADGGPTFDDLARLGWVLFDGGRWIVQSTPLGTLSQITYPSLSTQTFLTGLGKARLIAKTDTPPPRTQALVARIMAEDWLELNIPTRDPDWLAGRLWERLCPKPQPRAADDMCNAMQAATPVLNEVSGSSALLEAEAGAIDQAFLEWSAWCDILYGAGKWDIGWGPTELRYCREAAHRVLDRQALWGTWGTWGNDDVRYVDVLLNTFAIPQDRLRYGSSPRKAPPRTLVSRVDWLKRPEVEHLMMERLGVSTVSFAFGLLCSELEKTDIGPSTTAAAETVLSFAADHPMALQQFLFRVDAVPALLVDMLMHQRAACLAAKLAIEWRPESGRHSDRNVNREAQTKAFVVQDALSLLAYHLDKGTLDLEECASLVTWCYAGGAGSRETVADSRRPIGQQLLGMIAREKEELQGAVLQHLVHQAAYEDYVPRALFAGVLDGLNYLSNAPSAGAFPIVALYSKFARDLHLEWTDASNLPAELAARLVATAFAQAASDRDGLLVPFDGAKLLRETPDDERPSLRSSIARTLRGHVRLLARAVAGWPDATVPAELCDAFQALISRSVIEHAEKGRVGALTDRYSPNRVFAREESSPAQDLTAAWRRLDGSHQEVMLQALAQSDDPVLLAELCQHLPAAAKPGIQARLRQLKPGEASELWTWPELQHRIESLLVAGEYGLAREHLDEAEEDLDRAPPQFRLGLFGLGLQLLLKEKNWTALDSAVIPTALDVPTTRQAQDQLDFYRATSQLLRQNGNLADARIVLQRLSARPGAASAYKENVFAVAIQQLLGPTLHPLTGANKITGEGLLAEINAAVDSDEQLASSTLLTNRSLLLLALNRPEDALESVTSYRREIRSPDLELIAVLAKTEMGLQGEAMAILDAAITEFGADYRLIAAKNDLQSGVTTTSVASASVSVDPISSIRAALQQLTELPPSQVGDVLGPPGRGVRGYLVRQVSRAVAALQHMAAMLRDRKNPEDEARLENDLNTAVREVLGASLAVVKWDVGDQSLGGATLNGNPGERDAVIRVSGQEISIYEALVCSGLDRKYTKQHFDKLLSYGICDIYFHVTYSYAKELKPLVDYVRQMLEHEIPHGLTYLGCEILEPPDYETSGYIATYRADHREVAVVFLIADLKA